jgi:hypothetical protein
MDHPRHPNDRNPNRSPGGSGSLLRWKIVRQLAGWGLLMLGLVGLLLPILPGWVFIAWGVVTLSPDVPFFARLLDRIAHRVPPLRAAIERVRGQPEE